MYREPEGAEQKRGRKRDQTPGEGQSAAGSAKEEGG